MFTGLRDRALALARSPHGEWALFVWAFCESSFFPIPPDVALGPMAAAHPPKWARYAALTAAGSVLGSFLGYAIGYYFGATIGQWIFDHLGLAAAYASFQVQFRQWAVLAILAQGLIPVPYKLVTIACGMMHVPLWTLIACSIATRSFRFFAVAFLFKQYGPAMWPTIQKRIRVFAVLGASLVVGVLVALHYLT